jgi:membrane protein DedA with SNARE-associated domain
MPEIIYELVENIRQLPAFSKYMILTFSIAIEYVLPIFPGDTVVLISGFLNAHGAFDLLDISFAILVGSLLGAVAAYCLGALIAKNPQKYRWALKLTSSLGFIKFSKWYNKWGVIFLLINRFIPGIRSLIFISAGITGISFKKAVIFGCISAILFNGALIGLGYWLGYNTDLIIDYFYRYNAFVYILMGLFGLIIVLYLWMKKRYQ